MPRSFTGLLLVLVGMAVGLGAGLILGSRGEGAAPGALSLVTVPTVEAAENPPAAPFTTTSSAVRSSERRGVAPSQDAGALSPLSDAELAALGEESLAAVDSGSPSSSASALAIGSAGGILEGIVLGPDGLPIAGATVTAEPVNPSNGLNPRSTDETGRSFAAPEEVTASLRSQAVRAARKKALLRTRISSGDGTFVFEGLEHYEYTIDAYVEGLSFRSRDYSPGARVTLRGSEVHGFLLEVVDDSGNALSEATIAIASSPGNTPSYYEWSAEQPSIRTTRSTGIFQALGGHVEKLSRRSIFADLKSDSRRLTLESDGAGPHRFVVEPARTLVVEVIDPTTDGPTLTPRVRYAKLEAIDRVGRSEFTGNASRIEPSGDGRFRAADLSADRYLVGVYRGLSEPEVLREVSIGDRGTVEVIELPPLSADAFLIASVQDAEGRPRSGVSFKRLSYDEERLDSDALTAIERERGEYWVAWDREGEFWSGPVWLVATCPGAGGVSERVTQGMTRVRFGLAPLAEASVTVAGNPDATFSVKLSSLIEGLGDDVSYGSSNTAVTRGGSPVTFDGLQPGLVEVSVMESSDSNERSTRRLLAKRRVRLRPGAQPISMGVETLHELIVYAPAENSGTSLYLNPGEGNSLGRGASARLGKDKRAIFKDMVAGRYQLRISGSPSVEVEVPSGVLTYERPPTAGFRVTASRSRDIAPFADGDIVVEVAGESVEVGSVNDRIDLAVAKGKARVVVVRGGEEVELTLKTRPRYARFSPVASLERR
ncbi:MAG: hypothetical protein AAGG01_02920 [Planctomycetota bacterium]